MTDSITEYYRDRNRGGWAFPRYKTDCEIIRASKREGLTMNPFPYTKTPTTRQEAQNNVNHWVYIGLGDIPEGEIEANWRSYIAAMRRDAERELRKFS